MTKILVLLTASIREYCSDNRTVKGTAKTKKGNQIIRPHRTYSYVIYVQYYYKIDFNH